MAATASWTLPDARSIFAGLASSLDRPRGASSKSDWTGAIRVPSQRGRAGRADAKAGDRTAAARGHAGNWSWCRHGGDPFRFTVDVDHAFALRPTTESDLTDVSRWVDMPHVATWWTSTARRSRLRPITACAARRGPHQAVGMSGQRGVRSVLRDLVVPAYGGVSELFAAPDHRNARSLRVLAKLGATQGIWFDEPGARGGVDTVIGCTIDVARVLSHP